MVVRNNLHALAANPPVLDKGLGWMSGRCPSNSSTLAGITTALNKELEPTNKIGGIPHCVDGDES